MKLNFDLVNLIAEYALGNVGNYENVKAFVEANNMDFKYIGMEEEDNKMNEFMNKQNDAINRTSVGVLNDYKNAQNDFLRIRSDAFEALQERLKLSTSKRFNTFNEMHPIRHNMIKMKKIKRDYYVSPYDDTKRILYECYNSWHRCNKNFNDILDNLYKKEVLMKCKSYHEDGEHEYIQRNSIYYDLCAYSYEDWNVKITAKYIEYCSRP